MDTKKISNTEAIIAIIISLSIGLVSAILPVFGWSEYSLEGVMINCSFELRTLSVISYYITIFTFFYLLPIYILGFTNWKVIEIVSICLSNKNNAYFNIPITTLFEIN